MPKLQSIGALLLPLCMLTSNAMGDVLFQDDFEDGVIDPAIYIPIGNAILLESGGVLNIQTFGLGDGLEIVMPSGTACVDLKQTVLQDGFDRGEAWAITGLFDDAPNPDIEGVQIELRRPFWNRCQVVIKVGEDEQVIGVWG